MAHVVKPDYQKHPGLDNSESEDFWANSNVQDWLSAPFQDLCHSIWYSSAHMPILERVQSMHVVLMGTLNFLPVYTHSLVLQRTGIRDVLKELLNFRASLGHRGFLESLKCYRFDLDTLFTLLKDSERTEENLSRTAHRASADIYKCMYMCISVGVGMLVLFLQDRGSYKELLAYFLDLDSFSAVKPLICKVLLRLSCTSGLHPRFGQQLDGGAFGDIWKGLVGGHSVSVKIMRIFQDNDIQTVLKAFGREALIWRQLCHPNVLPFFGVYFLDNRLCLVSPWMDNGNVVNFLKQDPSYKDRLSLVLDVALGLEYLHGRNVVHGDLKGINILVTPSQRACIADFGLSSIVNAMTLRLLTTSSAPVQGGTARYQAPELFQLNEEDTPKTFASDVYGFACVCYEILTGRIPFHEFTNEIKVIVEVSAGKQPSRPLSCSGTTALDILWKLLQNCWDVEAKNRPTAHEIVQRLVGPSIRATTTSSKTDWDEELTCKFRRSLQTQPLLPSVNQIERMILVTAAEGKMCSTR
ncbi:kinase-like domain-containing protein [Mycena olivaceomarginata]|nr:kinase-like domain-containing protein [Mycena olivaceomarginata]